MGTLEGTVSRWFEDKGFGFITPDDGTTDVFAHCSDVGGMSLVIGGRVQFNMGKTERGKDKAVNISGAIGPAYDKGAKGKGGGGRGGGKGAAPYGGGAPPTAPPVAPPMAATAWATNPPVAPPVGSPVSVPTGSDKGEYTGVVQKWSPKGFGFVKPDTAVPGLQEGADLFAHHSDIDGGSLVAGGKVTFNIGETDQGKPKAIDIGGAIGPRLGPDGTPVRPMQMTGTVTNWWGEKGFGFIQKADGTDIFAHHSDIGGQSLIIGTQLHFDIGQTREGKDKAINIQGPMGPIGGDGKGNVGKTGGKKGGSGKGVVALIAAPKIIQAQVKMSVVVPAGAVAGQKLAIRVAGQEFEVDVPAGTWPGQEFPVQV